MIESELKFLLRPGTATGKAVKRISKQLRRAGFVLQPLATRQLQDTYYDTPDNRLADQAWSLRLRTSERGLSLTAKQLTSQALRFERAEIEEQLQVGTLGQALPFAHNGDCAALLHTQGVKPDELQSVYSHNNRRQVSRILHPRHSDGSVSWAIDRVTSSHACYTEMEFELAGGGASMLDALADVIGTLPELVAARTSKYQRGRQAHAMPGANTPTPAMTQFWHPLAQTHLVINQHNLALYEPMAWESINPEGVHQMRIATRKLQAWLALFGDLIDPSCCNRLLHDSTRLLKALGRVRDLDVHAQQIHKLAPRDGTTHRYYQRMRRRQVKAHRALTLLLANEFAGFQRSLDTARQNLHGNPANSAATLNQRAPAKLLPALEAIVRGVETPQRTSDPKVLHRLRIQLKQLRYQLQILHPQASAFDSEAGRVLNMAQSLQDRLGDHQDAWLGNKRVTIYVLHNQQQTHRHFRQFLDIQHAKMHRERGQVEQLWPAFCDRVTQLSSVLRRLSQA